MVHTILTGGWWGRDNADLRFVLMAIEPPDQLVCVSMVGALVEGLGYFRRMIQRDISQMPNTQMRKVAVMSPISPASAPRYP